MALARSAHNNFVGVPPNPYTSFTNSYNSGSGSNRYLVAAIQFDGGGTRTVSSMTYNGTSMTKLGGQSLPSVGSAQLRTEFWGLADPYSGGAANIIVNFSGAQWFGVNLDVSTFTGAATSHGTPSFNGTSATPHDQSVSIDAGSMIYTMSGSAYTFKTSPNALTIDGSSRTTMATPYNVNCQTNVGISQTDMTSGSKTVRWETNSNTLTNSYIEIKQLSSGATRRIFIVT